MDTKTIHGDTLEEYIDNKLMNEKNEVKVDDEQDDADNKDE